MAFFSISLLLVHKVWHVVGTQQMLVECMTESINKEREKEIFVIFRTIGGRKQQNRSLGLISIFLALLICFLDAYPSIWENEMSSSLS